MRRKRNILHARNFTASLPGSARWHVCGSRRNEKIVKEIEHPPMNLWWWLVVFVGTCGTSVGVTRLIYMSANYTRGVVWLGWNDWGGMIVGQALTRRGLLIMTQFLSQSFYLLLLRNSDGLMGMALHLQLMKKYRIKKDKVRSRFSRLIVWKMWEWI